MNGGPDSSGTLDGASPLELALDRAMDSYWAEERALYAQLCSQQHTPTNALVVGCRETALARPARLHWRGIEVSEEFQRYAARVANGEQLAPWRGQVLARPCAEFPWAPNTRVPQRPASPLFGRSAKIGAMLLSAGAALLAAVGVGSGTASTVKDELDDVVPDHGVKTLRPAAPAEDALASLGASRAQATANEGALGARHSPARRQRHLPRRGSALTPDVIVSVAGAPAVDEVLNGANIHASTLEQDEYARAQATTPEEWVELAMAGVASSDAVSSNPASSDSAPTAVPSAVTTDTPAADAAAAKAPASVNAAPARRTPSKPAASRVGVPSDWDPTGKMSILFSDDMPF